MQAMSHIRKSPKYINRRAQLVAEFEARRANGSAAADGRRQGGTAAPQRRKKPPATAQPRRTKSAASSLSPEEQKEVDKQLESEVRRLLTSSSTPIILQWPAAMRRK